MTGWIKLHRKFIEWEWYHNPEYVKFFIHILLLANHKPKKYKGVNINRGELTTSLNLLSMQLGYSTQKIRTILKKLQSTNDIKIVNKNNKHFTHISICNYESYQDDDLKNNNQITIKQQSNNNQITTNKNVKNDKNEKNVLYIKNPDFMELNEWDYPLTKEQAKKIIKKFSDYDFDEAILNDYLYRILNWNGKNKSVYQTLDNWIRKDISKGILKSTNLANY